MRGTVGQRPWQAINRPACDLANTGPCRLIIDRFGLAVTCIAELAGMSAAGALVHNRTNRVGIIVCVNAVQNYLGHSKLAFDGFTASFKIQSLGQALPFRIPGGGPLAVHPLLCIGKPIGQPSRGGRTGQTGQLLQPSA